mmetsp:Transcript_15377/g.25595  ORF Transcript_15377/g.25595 Transcript_15377/m.25595 type:complete len:159 (-) Transcript_15377:66-542(-)
MDVHVCAFESGLQPSNRFYPDSQNNVMSVYARVFIWAITLFLVFTNVYLIWEYMFFAQDRIAPQEFIPVLSLLSLLYLVCIYQIGKEDLESCWVSCGACLSVSQRGDPYMYMSQSPAQRVNAPDFSPSTANTSPFPTEFLSTSSSIQDQRIVMHGTTT